MIPVRKIYFPVDNSSSPYLDDDDINNSKDDALGESEVTDMDQPDETFVSETELEEEFDNADEADDNKTSFDEALQQWSNDNARDIAEDDSTPLRSNL